MSLIRIVSCDFYNCSPIKDLDVMYSEFRCSAIHQVPVIRIFGSSSLGIKTCLHVHGVFPYIYIPYDGKESPDVLLHQIATHLDRALNVSLGQASSSSQHIYKVCLVSGIPMYGYHPRKHQFLKIFFYNPLIMRKACTLLQNGNILEKIYQPHEAHVPYILQFMIDYNLHGMSFIKVSKIQYRYNSNLISAGIAEENILSHTIHKMSVCEREGDVLAEHILNRLEVADGQLVKNPGIASLWEDECLRRENNCQEPLTSQYLTQTRINVSPTSTHLAFKQILRERLKNISDKDEDSSLNLSVYPAETPYSDGLKDASFIESHSAYIDDSFIHITPSSDISFDDAAQDLLNALCDLNENAKDLEDDCILSQQPEIESEEEIDLSMPLQSVSIPPQMVAEAKDESNLWDMSVLEETIPQLDGNFENGKLQGRKNSIKSVQTKKVAEKSNVGNVTDYDGMITRSMTKIINTFKSTSKESLSNDLEDIPQDEENKTNFIDLNKNVKEDRIPERSMPIIPLDVDIKPNLLLNNCSYTNKSSQKAVSKKYHRSIINQTIQNIQTTKLLEVHKPIFNVVEAARPYKYVSKSHQQSAVNNFAKTTPNSINLNENIHMKNCKTITNSKKESLLINANENQSEINNFQNLPMTKVDKPNVLILSNKILDENHKKETCKILENVNFIKATKTRNCSFYSDIVDECVKLYDEIESFTADNYTSNNTKSVSPFNYTTDYRTSPVFPLEFDNSTLEYNHVKENSNDFLKEMNSHFFDQSTFSRNKMNFLDSNIFYCSKCNDSIMCSCKEETGRKSENEMTELNNNIKECFPIMNTPKRACNDSVNNKVQCKLINENTNETLNIKNCKLPNNEKGNQFNDVYAPSILFDKKVEESFKNVSDERNSFMETGTTQHSNSNHSVEYYLEHSFIKLCNDIKHSLPTMRYIEVFNSKGRPPVNEVNIEQSNNNSEESNQKCNGSFKEKKETTPFELNNFPKRVSNSYLNERESKYIRKESYNIRRKNKNCLLLNKSSKLVNGPTPLEKLENHLKYSLKPMLANRNINASVILHQFKNKPGNKIIVCKKHDEEDRLISPSPIIKIRELLQEIDTEVIECYQLTNLDGPNDSSSDEDALVEEIHPRKSRKWKHTTKFGESVKYTPLKVNVQSPKKNISGSSKGLQDSINTGVSKTVTTKLKSQSKKVLRSTRARNRKKTGLNITEFDAVKRKLIFKKCNETVTSEQLVCSYTSRANNKNTLPINQITEGNKEDSPECLSEKHSESLLEVPFARKSGMDSLNIADEYDVVRNYIPEPGTSKLTQNSISEKLSPNAQSSGEIKRSFEFYQNDPKGILITPKLKAPTRAEFISTMEQYNIPFINNQQPFYSDYNDVTGNVEIGNRVLKLSSNSTADLPEFETVFEGLREKRIKTLQKLYPELKLTKSEISQLVLKHCEKRDVFVTPVKKPPTRKEVETWLENRVEEIVIKERTKKKIMLPSSPNAESENDSLTLTPCTPADVRDKTLIEDATTTPKSSKSSFIKSFINKQKSLLNIPSNSQGNNSCQISGVTLNNTHGFKASMENYQEVKALTEFQHLSIVVMEVHTQIRGNFKPDPELDGIAAIFFSVVNDVPDDSPICKSKRGAIILGKSSTTKLIEPEGCDIMYVATEEILINEFVNKINEWDPDIFIGYEIEMLSWGYLVARGYKLEINLLKLLSRTPSVNVRVTDEDKSSLKMTGRIVLDFWRLLRHEIALQSYTFENVVYHLLHERLPHYSFKDLTLWWNHPSNLYRHIVSNYYFTKLQGILKLMDNLDLVGRTSELARLFGIQFYEVLSRGSQFRVESMMLRIAKPLNFIPVSPSVQQRAKMRAPEILPLILEPESKFYADPVIVLDFQSLYPSIIIAYNYCFTTCLGRVEHLGKNCPFEFGATQFKISRSKVSKLLEDDQLNFSPCGVAYVKPEIRKGILPQMLQEILDTRLMVKQSMKLVNNNKTLQRVLHSRQLGLKLIANVTYGYTAANFSGRMACVEVADSVVSKGRETLQRAINLVENTPKWGAKVVYGDTDSLFVMIPGKSKEDAFRIGSEIAETVTNENPSPIKLKLEKVYQPCILQTKKRYVGYMYESSDQKVPQYDAKGIETVRRDGCPAVAKMLEKCLRILFETRDVSSVKKYVLRQFHKILTGRVSIQDLTFAKEYRGASGYKPGACVPALELAKKWASIDKRNVPRSSERVPYVIINGPPGLPLIRLVRSPYELLSDTSLRPNFLYYITKVIIPPINRCFTLLGADVNTWFNEMPRKQVLCLPVSSPTKSKKSTISQYFSTTSCACCSNQTREGLCEACFNNRQTSMVILQNKVKSWEQSYDEIKKICQSCCGRTNNLKCISLDCPVYYRITQSEKDLQQAVYIRELINLFSQDAF